MKTILIPFDDEFIISDGNSNIADNNIIDCLSELADNVDDVIASLSNSAENKAEKKDIMFINETIKLFRTIKDFQQK